MNISYNWIENNVGLDNHSISNFRFIFQKKINLIFDKIVLGEGSWSIIEGDECKYEIDRRETRQKGWFLGLYEREDSTNTNKIRAVIIRVDNRENTTLQRLILKHINQISGLLIFDELLSYNNLNNT